MVEGTHRGWHPLRAIAVFADCTRRQLERLETVLQHVTVPPDTALVREGAVGRHACFVVAGRADVTVRGATVGTVSDGDSIGARDLLLGRPRRATVRSTTPMQLYVADRTAVEVLTREFPAVAARLRTTAPAMEAAA